MAVGVLGCSSVLPCLARSGRPRPISFLGIIAFLSCWACLHPFFSQLSDGGAGGGRGAGSNDGEDAEAQPVPTKAADNQVGAKQIHSNDNKNDDIQQLKLDLTAIRGSPASIEKHLATIVNLLNYVIARKENCRANSQGLSAVPVVTGTTENKDAVNRMKGSLGSMCSIADKLPMFCGPVFLWLLSNSSATNSPAPKAGQNFDDPWIQVIIAGSLILCFISFILMFFTSKFKDSESIDGVLFKISMWLLLPVFLTLWPGLLSFWYWGIYMEQKNILEELKRGCVQENVLLPENPKSEAASAQGLHRDNSYTTVQISGPSIMPAYALSK